MTYTQAKKALRDFIEEIEDDRVWKRTGTTFEECAADFMERRDLSGEFSQNTQLRYRRCFKAVSRHIGKAEVALITPEMIEGMYAAMRQGDTLSGKPSSGAYLNQINKTLDLMFRDLVEREVIVRNPIDKVATPKVDTKEKRALTPARMRQLVDQLEVETSCDIGYFLAITMGLRRGEICALSWRDIDFDNKVLTVNHNFDAFRNLKEAKTHAGMRNLPMPEFVCDALLRRKKAQQEYFLTRNYLHRGLKKGWSEQTEDTPVVLDFYAQRVHPDTFGKWWERDRKLLGLDGWCLHELRHSYLSMLAQQGVHPQGDAGARRPRQRHDHHGHLHPCEHGPEARGRRRHGGRFPEHRRRGGVHGEARRGRPEGPPLQGSPRPSVTPHEGAGTSPGTNRGTIRTRFVPAARPPQVPSNHHRP